MPRAKQSMDGNTAAAHVAYALSLIHIWDLFQHFRFRLYLQRIKLCGVGKAAAGMRIGRDMIGTMSNTLILSLIHISNLLALSGQVVNNFFGNVADGAHSDEMCIRDRSYLFPCFS